MISASLRYFVSQTPFGNEKKIIGILVPSKGKSHAQKPQVKRIEVLSGILGRGCFEIFSFPNSVWECLLTTLCVVQKLNDAERHGRHSQMEFGNEI